MCVCVCVCVCVCGVCVICVCVSVCDVCAQHVHDRVQMCMLHKTLSAQYFHGYCAMVVQCQ